MQKITKKIKNQSPSPSGILVFVLAVHFWHFSLIGKLAFFLIRNAQEPHFCHFFFQRFSPATPPRIEGVCARWAGCGSVWSRIPGRLHHRGQRAGVDDAAL